MGIIIRARSLPEPPPDVTFSSLSCFCVLSAGACSSEVTVASIASSSVVSHHGYFDTAALGLASSKKMTCHKNHRFLSEIDGGGGKEFRHRSSMPLLRTHANVTQTWTRPENQVYALRDRIPEKVTSRFLYCLSGTCFFNE